MALTEEFKKYMKQKGRESVQPDQSEVPEGTPKDQNVFEAAERAQNRPERRNRNVQRRSALQNTNQSIDPASTEAPYGMTPDPTSLSRQNRIPDSEAAREIQTDVFEAASDEQREREIQQKRSDILDRTEPGSQQRASELQNLNVRTSVGGAARELSKPYEIRPAFAKPGQTAERNYGGEPIRLVEGVVNRSMEDLAAFFPSVGTAMVDIAKDSPAEGSEYDLGFDARRLGEKDEEFVSPARDIKERQEQYDKENPDTPIWNTTRAIGEVFGRDIFGAIDLAGVLSTGLRAGGRALDDGVSAAARRLGITKADNPEEASRIVQQKVNNIAETPVEQMGPQQKEQALKGIYSDLARVSKSDVQKGSFRQRAGQFADEATRYRDARDPGANFEWDAGTNPTFDPDEPAPQIGGSITGEAPDGARATDDAGDAARADQQADAERLDTDRPAAETGQTPQPETQRQSILDEITASRPQNALRAQTEQDVATDDITVADDATDTTTATPQETTQTGSRVTDPEQIALASDGDIVDPDAVSSQLREMGTDGGLNPVDPGNVDNSFLLRQVEGEDAYRVETANIDDLRQSDESLDNVVENGEIRDFEPSDANLQPIVTNDGEVLDGYNRIAQAASDGINEIQVLRGVEAPDIDEAATQPARDVDDIDVEVSDTLDGFRVEDDDISMDMLESTATDDGREFAEAVTIRTESDRTPTAEQSLQLINRAVSEAKDRGLDGISIAPTNAIESGLFIGQAGDSDGALRRFTEQVSRGEAAPDNINNVPVAQQRARRNVVDEQTDYTDEYERITRTDDVSRIEPILRDDMQLVRQTEELANSLEDVESAQRAKDLVKAAVRNGTVEQRSGDQLIAIHNLEASEMDDVLEGGGFASPSFAVTRPDVAREFTEFGEVTVIFGEDTITPSREFLEGYTGDVYTKTIKDPTGPKADKYYEVNIGNLPEDSVVDKDILDNLEFETANGDVVGIRSRLSNWTPDEFVDAVVEKGALSREMAEQYADDIFDGPLVRVLRDEPAGEGKKFLDRFYPRDFDITEEFSSPGDVLRGDLFMGRRAEEYIETRADELGISEQEMRQKIKDGIVEPVTFDDPEGLARDVRNRTNFDEFGARAGQMMQTDDMGRILAYGPVDSIEGLRRVSDQFEPKNLAKALNRADAQRYDRKLNELGFDDTSAFTEKMFERGIAKFPERIKELSESSDVYADLTLDEAEEVSRLATEAFKNSLRTYAEMKLFDAAGLDEVQAVVVPDSVSDDLVQRMRDNGIERIVRYGADSGQSRSQAMDAVAASDAFGAAGGFEVDDEGNVRFDPVKGLAGVAGLSAAKSVTARQALRAAERTTKVARRVVDQFPDSYQLNKQQIINVLNKTAKEVGVKDIEDNIIRDALDEFDQDDVPTGEFIEQVDSRLMEMNITSNSMRQGEVEMRRDLQMRRGDEESLPFKGTTSKSPGKYDIEIYKSGAKIPSTDHHFADNMDNYFAHYRKKIIERNGNKIEQAQEIQSDLIQEREFDKTIRALVDSDARSKVKGVDVNDGDFSWDDINEIAEVAKNYKPSIVTEALDQMRVPGPDSFIENSTNMKYDEETYRNLGEAFSDVIESHNNGDIRVTEYRSIVNAIAFDPYLSTYKDTFHELIIRDRLKKAARSDIDYVDFPTGDTVLEIQGHNPGDNAIVRQVQGMVDNINAGDRTFRVGEEINLTDTFPEVDDSRWVILEKSPSTGEDTVIPAEQVREQGTAYNIVRDFFSRNFDEALDAVESVTGRSIFANFDSGNKTDQVDELVDEFEDYVSTQLADNSRDTPQKYMFEVLKEMPNAGIGTNRLVYISDEFTAVQKGGDGLEPGFLGDTSGFLTRSMPVSSDAMIQDARTYFGGTPAEDNPIYQYTEEDVLGYVEKYVPEEKIENLEDQYGQTYKRVKTDEDTVPQGPTEAFGLAGGIETDEEGNLQFDPYKAALGAVAVGGIRQRGALFRDGGNPIKYLDEMASKHPRYEEIEYRHALHWLKTAKAGDRYMTSGGDWDGYDSEFPDWVPEETGRAKNLRRKPLFQKVANLIENKEMPRANANRQKELIDIVAQRIDDRLQAATENPEIVGLEHNPVDVDAASHEWKRSGQLIETDDSPSGTIVSDAKADTPPSKPQSTPKEWKNLHREIRQRAEASLNKLSNSYEYDVTRDIDSQEAAQQSFDLYSQEDGGINNFAIDFSVKLQNTDLNPNNYTDITGFKGAARDLFRNTDKVVGDDWPKVKKMLLDPFDDSKGDFVDEQAKQLDELEEEVVEGLGIEKQSPESRAVMDYGEGKMSKEDLIEEFGEDRAEDIIEADKFFRRKYDQMLNEVNTVLKKVYPTNPEKWVERRQNYYRHFQEIGNSFTDLGRIFEGPDQIDPRLEGISAFTEPKSSFLSFAQRRVGGLESDRDAVGGFLDYVAPFAFQKHITEHIGNIRRFAKYVAEETAETPGDAPNRYIRSMQRYADQIAGKTNPADRFVQEVVPGGRTAFKALDWLNKRVKANTILGNVSSAVAQAFNIPQGIGSAGSVNSIYGASRQIGAILMDEPIMRKSTFLKERYSQRMYNRFDVSMLDNARNFASWMTGALDEVGTKFIWNAHYEKAVREGIENPVRYADGKTRRLVGGRGVGEVPVIQKSKLVQMAAPFQLEVQNYWWVMQDFVEEREFGKLAAMFVSIFLMNEVSERTRGNRVAFDPINASWEAFKIFNSDPNKTRGALRAGGRLSGEVLSNVLFGQTAAAMYPEYGMEIGGVELPTRREFFGEADPTRFGSGLLAMKGLQDPLFKILPPFGGTQASKTIGGAKALRNGDVVRDDGQLMFEVDTDSPASITKNLLFGEYSTEEARKYFDKDKEERILENEMEALYKENERLWENGKKEEAIENVKALTPEAKGVYDTVKNRMRQERREEEIKQMLPMVRQLKAMNRNGKEDEAMAAFRKLSDEEKEAYMDAKSRYESGDSQQVVEDDDGIISQVVTYAKAVGTDPQTAFERIFEGESIRRVDNGAIIIERMPFQESQNIRYDRDVKPNEELDHIVPLQLGGSNSEDNLQLVSEEKHEQYTQVGNYLGKELRAGNISGEEAQQLIKLFKDGKIGEDDVRSFDSEDDIDDLVGE